MDLMNGEKGWKKARLSDKMVVIVSSRASPVRKILADHGIASPFRWIFLGKDYSRLITLEQEFGLNGERILVGDRLQHAARTYRQDFIDLIGSLIPQKEQLRWWASSVSEKNPFISDVFLFFCYVTVAREVIASEKGNIVVICENAAVGKAIAEHCTDAADRIQLVPEPVFCRTSNYIARTYAGASRKCWFIFCYTCRILTARVFRFLKEGRMHERSFPQSRPVLLHTWTDARAFGKDNPFANVFLRGLAEKLDEQNRSCAYLADVLPTFSYIQAMSRLLKSSAPVYLLEEFLSIRDIFKSLLYLRAPPPVDKIKAILHGISLAGFIEEGLAADTLNTRREESYLRYLSTRQIACRLNPSSFVYLFENHVWEKLLIAGFRIHSPSTWLTGYAHTVVRHMQLSYSVAKRELNCMPLPDRIVVNGQHAKTGLVHSGFPADIIQNGGALRYPEVFKHVQQNRAGAGSTKKTVCIALSAGLNESIELLGKSLKALDAVDATIVIKCHPILPFLALSRYFPKLGNNVSVSDEPIGLILKRTDLLLYSETTVCIEALALGIPVIHVRSDCRIDLDVLDSLPSVRSESDPERLSEFINTALAEKVSVPTREELTFLSQIFSPVPPDIVEIFTPFR